MCVHIEKIDRTSTGLNRAKISAKRAFLNGCGKKNPAVIPLLFGVEMKGGENA